jgi:hypothetical protein
MSRFKNCVCWFEAAKRINGNVLETATIHNVHPKITLRMCHLIKQLMTFHFGGH